jgi:hypothetical protein
LDQADKCGASLIAAMIFFCFCIFLFLSMTLLFWLKPARRIRSPELHMMISVVAGVLFFISCFAFGSCLALLELHKGAI